MQIHIYNPEHDYALASNSSFYTPPSEICELRRRDTLVPLLWANAGDALVVSDDTDKKSLPDTPGITILHFSELDYYYKSNPGATISPWGWDPAILHRLIQSGIPATALPSVQWISGLRKLSHRRTSVQFNMLLNKALTLRGLAQHCTPSAVEFKDPVSALEWLGKTGDAFFKAPWSSSGRGILCTIDLDPLKHIEPWVRGIIRRQGSVLAEPIFNKKIDFATEWYISNSSDGKPGVFFIGLSAFNSSRRGKYHYQIKESKKLEKKWINSIAPDFNDAFIDAQKEALEQLLGDIPLSNRYTGYLGIDMMASETGKIHGGVELNFRHTMGIPPLDVLILGTGNVGTHLYEAFKAKGMRVGKVSGHADLHPTAEVYIIAVKDEAVMEVAERLNRTAIAGSMIVHTSGSIPIDILKNTIKDKSRTCGVFYPLQTFSANVKMNYEDIPFLVEGSEPATTLKLKKLANTISKNVRYANSEERSLYHLAAVITCNFSNHLCTLADRFLSEKGLDFKMLLPLLRQTISKLDFKNPSEAQTGPASRGDISIINSHLLQLQDNPELAKIYELLSNSILNSR